VFDKTGTFLLESLVVSDVAGQVLVYDGNDHVILDVTLSATRTGPHELIRTPFQCAGLPSVEVSALGLAPNLSFRLIRE